MVDAMSRIQPIPICVEQRSILKCVRTGSNPVLITKVDDEGFSRN